MSLSVSLSLLVERLHWPVPRVRWEAARQLSGLIRSGDQSAHDAMLAWCGTQKLEADAAILPSIIHAFELHAFFAFDEVSKAIVAPSVLSDALLARLYPGDAKRLFSFRLDYTKGAWAEPRNNELFDDGIGTLVPRIFHSMLSDLQRQTELPFIEQWQGEWQSLQANFSPPYTSHPSYFFRGDRGQTGSLDVRQRAVYVSAFLRTLSWALLERRMPHDVAGSLAEVALPFNRGLAHFEASERPAWSKNFLDRFETLGAEGLAKALWRDAAATLEAGFEPLCLDVIDSSEHLAVRVEVHRVLEERASKRQGTSSFATPGWINTDDDHWALEGSLSSARHWRDEQGSQPMSVAAQPRVFGRAHIDLVLGRLLVADPILATGAATLACESDRMVVTDEAGLFSTLRLWYVDWEPTHPPELGWNGSLTSCRSTALRQFRRDCAVSTPRLARVRIAKRKYRYEPYAISTRTFRI